MKEQIKKGLLPGKSEYELVEKFPVKEIEVSIGRYDNVRKKARKKWIAREVKRRHHKLSDTYSIATAID